MYVRPLAQLTVGFTIKENQTNNLDTIKGCLQRHPDYIRLPDFN